jgi:membrane associated rhomboid family serine protease
VRAKLWLSLCLIHAVASMLVWWAGGPVAQALTWRADSWAQHPWTLWTTSWVHINTPHLIGNQLAVGALAAMAWLVRPNAVASVAWLLAWPTVALVLPWWPHIGYAVGLSGLIHAAVAVVAVHLWWCPDLTFPSRRRWGALLAAGLTAKLALEQGWHWPVVWSNSADMSVVQAAHLTGAVAGVVFSWTLVMLWRHVDLPVPAEK